MTVMRLILALLAMFALFTAGGCAKEKTTDLAQEMAARKMVMEVKLLMKEGRDKQASEKLIELEKRFGHTKSYTEAKQSLYTTGLSVESPEIALTGIRLIDLENLILSYKKETGKWPAPGMIAKPLDAWDNELYWIVAAPGKSYDLLIISAGPDFKPGTGDELIVVWVKRESEKKKKTGPDKKGKGAGAGSKKKPGEKKSMVMTLEDLLRLEKESGVPVDRDLTLKQFQKAGEASKKAGQPRRGETLMSLEEIKTKL